MAYKVVDIYRDLPRKPGCSDCGKPGCFAFATSVHLEGNDLSKCVHLDASKLAEMLAKADAARAAGEGPREQPEAQAARELQSELARADLAELAEKAAVRLVAGPPEALEVELFGRTYHLRRDDVVASDGGDVDVWVKVLLLMYVTRASGEPVTGEWVAYRDLPNTISKHKTFEKWVDRLPRAWTGRFEALDEVVRRQGGVRRDDGSADLVYDLQALPRVPLRLMLWESDGDFEPRGSLLLDRGVLDYLDQEALTFLAEELMRQMSPDE